MALLDASVRLARSLSPCPDMQHADALYLSYYDQNIACMISTTNMRNGFRTDLLPMAMASPDETAVGLRNAMLAVASFHLSGRSAALPYKTRAVRLLAQSLVVETARDTTYETLQTRLATCMMLCVYDVFDEKECQWSLHMHGARQLFLAFSKHHDQHTDSDFLPTWFMYHEVFGRLSQRCQPSLGDWIMKYSTTGQDPRLIIGSIGCSIEMLGLINAIDAERVCQQSTCGTSSLHLKEKNEIESRLLAVKQHDSTDIHGRVNTTQQTAATAELYRLAALLYLHQVLPQPEDQHRRAQHIDSAFSMLRSMSICTSPWPLFTIACEAGTDEQRILLLDMLDRMDETRKIGNVFGLRNIIEQVWKQTDLRGKPLQWWTMFDLETTGPWFI